jgi:hypothetical protein
MEKILEQPTAKATGSEVQFVMRSETKAQGISSVFEPTPLHSINAVGMAVQILDSIPESESQLKNQTRSEIVRLLLVASRESVPAPEK